MYILIRSLSTSTPDIFKKDGTGGAAKASPVSVFSKGNMRTSAKPILLLLLLLSIAQGAAFAATTTINVSATILSKSNCKFSTNMANLAFGNLDPLAAPDVTRQATLTFVCNGKDDPATYLITDDDGQHETGLNRNRMQHGVVPSAYLLYSFALNPASGTVPKGMTQTLTVTGTLFGNDYRVAIEGTYTDVVTLTINP
jgi:spore coat protein U-like protein